MKLRTGDRVMLTDEARRNGVHWQCSPIWHPVITGTVVGWTRDGAHIKVKPDNYLTASTYAPRFWTSLALISRPAIQLPGAYA